MYMETVSLNDDDAPVMSSSSSSSTFLDVDSLEAQFASSSTQDDGASLEIIVPVSDDIGNSQYKNGNMESRNSQMNKKKVVDSVVVDVNNGHKDSNGFSSQSDNMQHVLPPPLRVLTQHLAVEERDYVDTTLFSPDMSSHAMEVAHRRAKALATEVKEMTDLEVQVDGTANVKTKLSPAEAMGIIGGAFANSLQRAKKFLKPALKRISAYSSAAALEPEKTLSARPQKKKSILWHEDVLDADEEFYENNTDGQETCSLMNPNEAHATEQKEAQKKLLRSMMRRLTPREKEELYRQRPDLMIVPNWAQKYREEIAGEDSTRWNAWLLGLIMVLAVLLLVFFLLVVRQRAVAVT
ncbi:unnamed protein product [Peronospora destructor]|uniref:Uncharacterized protein n=1 Tax=Peronospora destructor TaxID=86335 RepID=A0AAV0TTD0_9STRA|nr:unnamed protein product [Peronospora destructor]